MIINKIIEIEKILIFLQKRNLVKQYKKAKLYILAGHLNNVLFKIREPKEKGIYSFRINKQFRAFAVFKNNTLRIIKINNHQ